MSTDPCPRLTAADRRQLAAHGLSGAEVKRQLAVLASPPPAAPVLRPCTVGDGILRLAPADFANLEKEQQAAARAGRFSKFVPASGAATRMFADLLAAWAGSTTGTALTARDRLVRELDRLPFSEPLAAQASQPAALLDALLSRQGLDLASRPKALVPFHRIANGSRTAFAEHLAEAAEVVTDGSGICRLHFTVGADYQNDFDQHLNALREPLETAHGVRFEVAFSHQGAATDTIALTPHGEFFRRRDGQLLLRPGGHGALLANLEAAAGDLVLVKNIDNILPAEHRQVAARYQRLLGGLLARLQNTAFEILEHLDSSPPLAGEELAAALEFAADSLQITAARQLADSAEPAVREFLRYAIDRPLRVCGMVPNEGEPGGGPFWVGKTAGATAQIVEAAQIDRTDPRQQAVVAAATHFNPVDLACALRDRHGKPYRLADFVDPATAFVSRKTAGDRPLLALEHPGLWNGAMAHWTTVFVEVPAATFAPVKTVFDLLRPEHQTS